MLLQTWQLSSVRLHCYFLYLLATRRRMTWKTAWCFIYWLKPQEIEDVMGQNTYWLNQQGEREEHRWYILAWIGRYKSEISSVRILYSLSQQGVCQCHFGHPNPQKSPIRTTNFFESNFLKCQFHAYDWFFFITIQFPWHCIKVLCLISASQWMFVEGIHCSIYG